MNKRLLRLLIVMGIVFLPVIFVFSGALFPDFLSPNFDYLPSYIEWIVTAFLFVGLIEFLFLPWLVGSFILIFVGVILGDKPQIQTPLVPSSLIQQPKVNRRNVRWFVFGAVVVAIYIIANWFYYANW